MGRQSDPRKAAAWERWIVRFSESGLTVAAKDGYPRLRIDKTQLAMILGGVRLETAQRRKRYRRVLA